MPYELEQLPPVLSPLELTSQARLSPLARGERSHQLVADPFSFAIRLLRAELPVPASKYDSLAPSMGKARLSLCLKPT